MNTRQAANLNRYNAVISQLSNETAAIASVPAAEKTFGLLSAKVATINALIPRQSEKSSPFTHSKRGARAALVSAYIDLAAQVYAWADERGDITTRGKYDLVPSDISRLKDSVLPNEAEALYRFLLAHAADLTNSSITVGAVDNFAQLINGFINAAVLPRTTITTRSTQVRNLVSLFAEADHLLEDRLIHQMVALKTTYPDVYTTFISNCKVIVPHPDPAKTKARKARKAARQSASTTLSSTGTPFK